MPRCGFALIVIAPLLTLTALARHIRMKESHSSGLAPRRERKPAETFFLVLAGLLLLCSSDAWSQAEQTKRVLVFSEFGPATPVMATVLQQIKVALDSSAAYHIELYSEYLETTLFPDDATQEEFRAWYIHKYRERRPDVMVAVGAASLKFLQTRPNFFPNVPVVFVATSVEQADNPRLDLRFTGAWVVAQPSITLDLALRLQPDVRNVFVVGGVATFDRHVEQIVKDALSEYAGELSISYLTELDWPTLLKRVGQLPAHSVIYFTSFTEDAAGGHFINALQSLPVIAATANAPLYGLSDSFIGRGIVGGYVTSYQRQGEVAADDVLRILAGERPDQIPIVYGTNEYLFDWRAMRRWGLDPSKVPPKSTVLYREPTLWERYRWQIILIALAIFALGLLSLYLALETQGRKRAEQSVNASLEFERLISELSTYFINMPAEKIDAGITDALDRLVAFLQIDRASVFEFSPDCTQLNARHGRTAPHIIDGPMQVNRDQCEWAFLKLLNKESIVVNTLAELPKEAESLKLLYEHYQAKSNVLVPMEAEGSVSGCLSLVTFAEERIWPERLIQQLSLVGQIFANALLRKHADQERFELTGRLINAQEEERHRIARELHDDVSQRIAVLAVDLERGPRTTGSVPDETAGWLQELSAHVSEIGADLHSLSHSLHSSTLETLGLVEGLASLCEEFTEQHDIEVEFSHENVPRLLSPGGALCFFRIAQEGLRNVRKHSRASRVQIRLTADNEGLRLALHDNGIGFSVNHASTQLGIGLRSMEERLRLVGGHLKIESTLGAGTQINAWAPLSAGQPDNSAASEAEAA